MKHLLIVSGVLLLTVLGVHFWWPAETRTATAAPAAAVQPHSVQSVPSISVPPVPSAAESSAFATFQRLNKKALRSRDEERAYRQELASEKVAGEALARLRSFPSVAKGALAERFAAIHYYDRALGWNENPLRPQLVREVVGVLKQDIKAMGLSVEERKVLAGDKVELYALLLREDPETAAQLYAENSDAQLQKVLRFAKARFDNEVFKE